MTGPVRRPRARAFGWVGVLGTAAATYRAARRGEVGKCEEQVFRWFNRRSDRLARPVWVVMQTGSLAAVFLLAGAALRRGRPRQAAFTAVYGTAVWGAVKLVKPGVRRGRPADHLDAVVVRGERQRGLGYPSGHAAVALALGLMAPRALGLDERPTGEATALGLAAVTGATRMYVGAHLPLDVLGGMAIGAGAGRLGASVLGRIDEAVGSGRAAGWLIRPGARARGVRRRRGRGGRLGP